MNYAQLVQQLIALAVKITQQWQDKEPGNPTAAEWLALLEAPSLKLTYDQQIAAAEARAKAK